MKNLIGLLAIVALVFGLSSVANAECSACTGKVLLPRVGNVASAAVGVVERVVSDPVRLVKAVRAKRCACASCSACAAPAPCAPAACAAPAPCAPVAACAPAACAAPAACEKVRVVRVHRLRRHSGCSACGPVAACAPAACAAAK